MKQAAILIGLTQACALAFGQAQAPSAPSGSRTASEASFVCGGVGLDEQQSMKSAASQHDLMLTFAASNGAYLADVDVEIRNSKGAVVLSAKCNGPLMLVDLPAAGTWSITARANGETRRKTLTAGSGRHAQTTFTWPAGA
jgi:hypothetical protein